MMWCSRFFRPSTRPGLLLPLPHLGGAGGRSPLLYFVQAVSDCEVAFPFDFGFWAASWVGGYFFAFFLVFGHLLPSVWSSVSGGSAAWAAIDSRSSREF